MTRKLLTILAAGSLLGSTAVGQAVDPALAAAIVQIGEGDFQGAIESLGPLVRSLAGDKSRTLELAQAYLYLGVAHVGLKQDEPGRAYFREALNLNKNLVASPDKFSVRVIRIFDEARREIGAAPTALGRAPAQATPSAKPTQSSTAGHTGGVTPGQAAQPATPALSPQEVFDKVSPSVFVVVMVDQKNSRTATGSAVAIAKDRLVTNLHVAVAGPVARVARGSQVWSATVIKLEPTPDLAVLYVADLKAPPVTFRGFSDVKVGERVFTIGAPKGLELTLAEGLVSALREDTHGNVIQTSAPISPGSSGGGLFDDRGRLVGITTFQVVGGQNLDFAVAADYAKALAVAPFSPGDLGQPTIAAQLKMDLALAAIRGNQPTVAVALSDSAALLGPNDEPTWMRIGQIQSSLGAAQKAIQAFERATQLRPDDVAAWNALSRASTSARKYDEAETASKEAMRLKPTDPSGCVSLGILRRAQQRRDDALTAFRKAIEVSGGADAAAWFELGETLQGAEAADALRKAVALDPKHAKAWNALGNLYSHDRLYDKATEAYEKAVAADASFEMAWRNLSRCYRLQHQMEKAAAACGIALSLKPDEPEALNTCGLLFYEAHKYDNAVAAYKKALEARPNDHVILTNLGEAYRMLRQPTAALDSYRAAVRLQPKYAQGWYGMCTAATAIGDKATAQDAFKQLESLDKAMAQKCLPSTRPTEVLPSPRLVLAGDDHRLTPDQIKDAIAAGTSGRMKDFPHVVIGRKLSLGARARTPILVGFSTPFVRVAVAAAEAKKIYKPFTESDVTAAMLAPTLVIGVDPLVTRFTDDAPVPQHVVLDCAGQIVQPIDEKSHERELSNSFGAKRTVRGLIASYPASALDKPCVVKVVTDEGEKTVKAEDVAKALK